MNDWGYFDIEAQLIGEGAGDVSDFIIGAVLEPGTRAFHSFDDIREFIEFLVSSQWNGKTWVCHNAEYDLKFILPILHTLLPEGTWANIVTQGVSERTIGLVYHPTGARSKEDITFKDSFAVLPSGLGNLTKVFDVEHKKLDIGLAEGHVFDPSSETDMKYLRHDLLGLMEVCEAYEKMLNDTFGSTTKMTTGATAMTSWKSVSPDQEFARFPKRDEEFMREAYFGGHVFLSTVNEQADVTYLDFNSMYPSVMRLGVPYGQHWRVGGEDWQVFRNMPGFWKCDVVCPRTVKHPFIRFRDKNSSLAPYGEFTTTMTSMELNAALEHGYVIKPIEGIVFEKLVFPFNEFIDKCEQMRKEYKGTPIEYVVKINQNSLYGKFGARADTVSYVIANVDPSRINPENWVEDPVNGGFIEGLYKFKTKREKEYMFPGWAAWITAQARLKLMSLIWTIGEEHVFYGDTDSLVVDTKRFEELGLKEGAKYGEFKIEHRFKSFTAKAPKHYKGADDQGNVTRKSKGIPKRFMNENDHDNAISGDKVTVHVIMSNSLLSMLKRNAKQWRDGTRSYSCIVNSDNWVVFPDGRVVNKTVTKK
jgi:hypothetical protein